MVDGADVRHRYRYWLQMTAFGHTVLGMAQAICLRDNRQCKRYTLGRYCLQHDGVTRYTEPIMTFFLARHDTTTRRNQTLKVETTHNKSSLYVHVHVHNHAKPAFCCTGTDLGGEQHVQYFTDTGCPTAAMQHEHGLWS